METFIVGQLVNSQPSATYEGGVYTRNLSLKHSSGALLDIFDFECISTDLVIGRNYELVLNPTILRRLSITSTEQSNEERIWTGKIVDTEFQFTENCCSLYIENLFSKNRVLVSSSLGNLILNPSELSKFVSETHPGEIIWWEFLRLDLLAVIRG